MIASTTTCNSNKNYTKSQSRMLHSILNSIYDNSFVLVFFLNYESSGKVYWRGMFPHSLGVAATHVFTIESRTAHLWRWLGSPSFRCPCSFFPSACPKSPSAGFPCHFSSWTHLKFLLYLALSPTRWWAPWGQELCFIYLNCQNNARHLQALIECLWNEGKTNSQDRSR